MELSPSGSGVTPHRYETTVWDRIQVLILSKVATVRQAGIFAKVNRIVFTQQGNKFGVCDGDGNTALWQVMLEQLLNNLKTCNILFVLRLPTRHLPISIFKLTIATPQT